MGVNSKVQKLDNRSRTTNLSQAREAERNLRTDYSSTKGDLALNLQCHFEMTQRGGSAPNP